MLGLPPSGSWQDLKDHMREAGDVCFADAFKDGSGVVEFLRYEDMKYAIKKLDDSRFRSHEVGVTLCFLITNYYISITHLCEKLYECVGKVIDSIFFMNWSVICKIWVLDTSVWKLRDVFFAWH